MCARRLSRASGAALSFLYALNCNHARVLGSVSHEFESDLQELVSELRAVLPDVLDTPEAVSSVVVVPDQDSERAALHTELLSTIIQGFAVGAFGIFIAVKAQRNQSKAACSTASPPAEKAATEELDDAASRPNAKPTAASTAASASKSSNTTRSVKPDFGDALAALRRRGDESPKVDTACQTPSGRVAAAVTGATPTNKQTPVVEDWQRGNAKEGVSQCRDELPRSRASELLRSTQRLLNKVCPENVATIVEQLADIQVNDGNELAFVSGLIFKRALRDPHYVETYADLFFGLNAVWPEFPPAENGGSPTTFLLVLLEKCRDEFEALPATFEATSEERATCELEELEYMLKQRKDRMLAFMRLMGNLFLRGLLNTGAIGAILRDLVRGGKGSNFAGELEIECTCELLRSVGAALQNDPEGCHFVSRTCGQLAKLRKDGATVYSKRLQFMMQDVIDLRDARWVQKAFKTAAKTKDDLRQEAACEEQLKHHGEDGVLMIVAGARPECIAGTKVNWGESEVVRIPVQQPSNTKAATSRDNAAHIPLPLGGARKILGPSCATVQALQEETGARVWVDAKNMECVIKGTDEAVAAAKRGVLFLIENLPEDVPTEKTRKIGCKYYMQGHCSRGKECAFAHEEKHSVAV